MYYDPLHLRDKPIKVRLNNDHYEVVKALARLNKRQLAVYARDLILQGITLVEQPTEKHTQEAHAK